MYLHAILDVAMLVMPLGPRFCHIILSFCSFSAAALNKSFSSPFVHLSLPPSLGKVNAYFLRRYCCPFIHVNPSWRRILGLNQFKFDFNWIFQFLKTSFFLSAIFISSCRRGRQFWKKKQQQDQTTTKNSKSTAPFAIHL